MDSPSDRAGFDAELAAARAQHRAGRTVEAEAVYRRLNRQVPDHPEPWHLLAVLAHQQGVQEHAVALAREAIARRPDVSRYHNTLGSALRLLGEGEAAEAAFACALDLEPDQPLYAGNLAVALLDRGAAEAALARVEQGLGLAPRDPSLRNIAGLCLQRLGRLPAALAAFEAALDEVPDFADADANRRVVLLQMNRPDRTAAAARDWLARYPADRDALTHLAAAHAQAGAAAELADLVRLESHVCQVDPVLPGGGHPDPDFNAVLARHCLAHPTLQAGRHNKATEGGSQTDDLTVGAPQELRDLLAALDAAARRLAQAHAEADPLHPWAAHPPRDWDIRVWATVLRRGGHQRPHTHPAGWMSGVYYVDVPPSENPAAGDARAGWIEFGRPDPILCVAGGYALRDIRAQAGQAVLFPSFVWHRTHPFAGDRARISIAFDFRPRD